MKQKILDLFMDMIISKTDNYQEDYQLETAISDYIDDRSLVEKWKKSGFTDNYLGVWLTPYLAPVKSLNFEQAVNYFKDYANWGANLTFSGHVHGGIMQVPFIGGVISPKLKLFPEYDKGLFENSGKYMILSGGLGNHTIKFRINNLPEIVLVTLENSGESEAYKIK